MKRCQLTPARKTAYRLRKARQIGGLSMPDKGMHPAERYRALIAEGKRRVNRNRHCRSGARDRMGGRYTRAHYALLALRRTTRPAMNPPNAPAITKPTRISAAAGSETTA